MPTFDDVLNKVWPSPGQPWQEGVVQPNLPDDIVNRMVATSMAARNEQRARTGPWQTQLSPQQEALFQAIAKNHPFIGHESSEAFPGFDWRGFFQSGAPLQYEGDEDYPSSKFITPYSPIFGQGSQYYKR